MQVLYDQGYEAIESDQAGDETYSFSGLSGSHGPRPRQRGRDGDGDRGGRLGHQRQRVPGATSTAATTTTPRSSSTPPTRSRRPTTTRRSSGSTCLTYSTDHSEVQIIGTNDFHGRLLADGANAAGAAVLAGAVDELRADNPDTGFVAAGDLIGASTFESFIQDDEPTIEALNEAGLDVSAAGNHEFDQGYEDLVGRVQDLADWEYIAANVVEPAGRDDLAESWTQTFDTDAGEIEVGYVGAVTEDLPSLVSPAGIQGVTVTDIVDATNTEAASPEGRRSRPGGAARARGLALDDLRDDDRPDHRVGQHRHRRGRRRRRHRRRATPTSPTTAPSRWPAGPTARSRSVRSSRPVSTAPSSTSWSSASTTPPVTLVAKSQDVIGLVGTGYAPNAEVAATVAAAKAEADVLGAAAAGSDRRSLQPGAARERHDGEPRWRVHPRQPGGRGAALGDAEPGVRLGADRVHEPGWSAGRHGRDRDGGVPAHADLQAGCRGPAVRQHAGEHGPDGCRHQARARAAVAARRRGRGPVSAVPAARCLEGLHLHLRPGARGGFADHRDVARW